jgi:hypothetical protein
VLGFHARDTRGDALAHHFALRRGGLRTAA